MNIRPYIILNGIDSSSIRGLLVTDLPPIIKPLVRTQVDVIDGRDGDIVTKLGYSSYDKPVKVVNEGEGLLIDRDPSANADLTQEYVYGQGIGVGVICAAKLGYWHSIA